MHIPTRAHVRKEQSVKALLQKLDEAKDENGLLSQALQDLQAEQTKYEARIVGLQRAKQEAVAKAEAQSQKATHLQQELDRLTTEKARWQSQERAQLLKGKKLHERQVELEDALIDLKREADESASAAEQARAEAAQLLNRLHAKDAAVASAESARDDALCQAREATTRSQQGQSDQAEAWREERDALLDRAASLEDSLAASSAFAAAAAEAAPQGCGEECEGLRHEIGRLQHELQALLQRFQEQRDMLAHAAEELRCERREAQQLQQQREGEAAAAAALREGATQAREHSQQAMRWVHRLRAEVLEMEQALQASHAGKLELVREKLRLADALCRATDMLAAERAGSISADMEESPVREDDDCRPAEGDVHRQLADAVAAERDMLHRLECEIRRVLELERMRIADLRDNTEIHERLEAETEVSWGLREALAERRLDAQQ
ncbi:g7036 [Coccomyxa viridis]|uniref:G7036 protein n=1 Tax=Coccomyxa viridis TaxID=1274662 RepID=A0ABP1G1R0_9CHLO